MDDDHDEMPTFLIEPVVRPPCLPHPVTLWVVSVGLAAGAAALAWRATVSAVVDSRTTNCAASDATCGLWFELVSLQIGAAVAGIAYLCTGLAIISRCRTRRSRPGPVAALVVTPLVVVIIDSVRSGAL